MCNCLHVVHYTYKPRYVLSLHRILYCIDMTETSFTIKMIWYYVPNIPNKCNLGNYKCSLFFCAS